MTLSSGTTSALSGWWRWPLLPIAAPLGAFAGSAIFMLLQWFGMKMQGVSEKGWLYLYILPVMQSIMFGYLYTLISCRVAPFGKMIAGVVMVTLLTAGLGSLLILAWIKVPFSGELVQSTVAIGAISGSSIFTLLSLRDEL